MDRTYLQEAFKSMQLLEEENFKLDDINLKDIKDFIMNDEEDELVAVFDDGAETEDELEETYIGKVILECEVCHSPIFKDVNDVHVDEETDLANIDDECPICHSQDGFKIVGEVAPFQEDPELKVEVEDKPECEDGECDEFDDDFEECDGMCTFDREYDEEDDDVSDIFGESLNEKVCKKCGKDVKEPCIEEAKEVCPDCGKEICECDKPLKEGFEKVDLEMEDKIIHVSEEQKEPIPDAEMITPVSDELEAELTAPETEEEMPVEEAPVEEVPEEPIEAEGEEMPVEDEFTEEPLEDEDMPLETEDEFDGQESLHEELDPELEDKLDELKDEIDELEDKIDDVAENICPECETDEIDAEYDDKEAEDEDAEAEKEDEVDFDVEDFDEDTFDELGESYLKSVYENVNSFKTTAVKACENRLTVEGLIKFNSGKEKQTQFVFEAADATKSGKVRFIGENAQITRGKKAFTLAGRMNGTRFMAESLNYNYRAKDTEGKSTRLYGTLKVKA